MLKLDTRLQITPKFAHEANLAPRLSREDQKRLGAWVKEGYNRDKGSRSTWETRMQNAMDIALQLQKAKSFPWPDCSNVVFPLVTIAALQFHSRAYPALINGNDLVRYRVPKGTDDPQGLLMQAAERVGDVMSRQCLEEDCGWEEQHDRLLMVLPILGCAFMKTYYSAEGRHNSSELVLPQDLVMSYYSKSVEASPRKTQIVLRSRNEIYERVQNGVFLDVLDEGWYLSMPSTQNSSREDQRTGTRPAQPADENTPFTFLEQHTWFDLDQDGYAEPYIMTIEETSNTLVRLVARWDRPEDVQRNARGALSTIRPTESFTKYTFLPSPDGSVYDFGFGMLLGPLNESVNTAINQLIDAGTMATTAGGFLGRGAKMRSGVQTFAPFQWNRVDMGGDDIRKNIFPLPVREPSRVLFDLLSLLINYTNTVSGAVDSTLGILPGQNTPAETSRNSLEQGLKIFSAIYKRCWRGMKEEFSKLYQLNAANLAEPARKDFLGDPKQIAPVADPTIISDTQRLQRALTVKQAAMGTPGYSIPEVEKAFLKALNVDNLDVIYPGPDKVPPLPNPKVQVEQMKLQAKQMEQKQGMMQFVLDLREQARVNNAKIMQMQAQAALAMEQAGGVQTGHDIAAFEAAIGAMKLHNDSINKQIELLMKGIENDSEQRGMGGTTNQPNVSSPPPGPAGMGGGGEGGMG